MAALFGDYEVAKKSGLFDPEYYLATYPDVAQRNIDPLVHYLEEGAREGRNPRTGETIQIAAGYKVKFKAAKALRDRLPAAEQAEALGLDPLPDRRPGRRYRPGRGQHVVGVAVADHGVGGRPRLPNDDLAAGPGQLDGGVAAQRHRSSLGRQ